MQQPHASPSSIAHFADRLAAAVDRAGNFACVGLDPVLERLPPELRAMHDDPADAIGAFSLGVVRAVAGVVPAVKFQSACFERYGWRGVRKLEEGLALARELGLITILDAKRGDIGVSAEHYAFAAFSRMQADALTVSPYMGPDTIEPFLQHPGTGVFVLARTSNPQSDTLQSLRPYIEGTSLAEHVGAMIARLGAGRLGQCGLSSVGAVVAATKPGDAAAMRRVMPDQIFLIPGFGAQGGTAADVRELLRLNEGISRSGVLVTASRSVIYPTLPGGSRNWEAGVRAASEHLVGELTEIMPQ